MRAASPRWGRSPFAAGLACAACALISFDATAQDTPAGSVYVDGLSVLCGGAPGDESASSPILTSDVVLQARLMRLEGRGERWAPLDAELLGAAQRRLAFTRLLAQQARQAGEAAAPELGAKLLKQIEARAGGPEGIGRVLRECGCEERDLAAWIDDAILALAQLTYIEERIEPPSDGELEALFIAGGHPFEGQPFAEVRSRFSRHVMRQRLEVALRAWLEAALRHKTVRLLR